MFAREEWERPADERKAILSLSQQEAKVLASFVGYWLGPGTPGPIYPVRIPGEDAVSVAYDY